MYYYQGMGKSYYVYQMSLIQANMVYKSYHRHLNDIQGHQMSFLLTGTKDYYKVNKEKDYWLWLDRQFVNPLSDLVKDVDNIGVLSIGRPVGRFKDKSVAEITRICFHPNFKPRGKPDSFARSLPSKFVMKALEIYKTQYPKVTKVITYITEDESGLFLKHAGFKVDKIVKPSDGWVKRREKEWDQRYYAMTEYQARKFEEKIEVHKKMVKTKLRFVKNI